MKGYEFVEHDGWTTSEIQIMHPDADVPSVITADEVMLMAREINECKQKLAMVQAEAKAAVMQRNQAEQAARETTEIVGRLIKGG